MNPLGTDAATSESTSAETRSKRALDHQVKSPEKISTEPLKGEYESAETKPLSPTITATYSPAGVVPAVPATVEGRSAWFAAIAADEELAILQLPALGAQVSGLQEAFASLITGETGAAELIRGERSDEIVYHDRSLTGTLYEFMPLPFVLACQVNARPVKPPVRHLIEWRPRLMAKAGLIVLEEVQLPPLLELVAEYTRLAYEGVRLLFGCRWYLEPGTPIPYSISFIQTWCGITRAQAVAARSYLRRFVLREVGTVACGRPNEMQLFLPRGTAE